MEENQYGKEENEDRSGQVEDGQTGPDYPMTAPGNVYDSSHSTVGDDGTVGVEVGGSVPTQTEPKEEQEKESHLYQEATVYDPSGTGFYHGVLENEYDDGTVEVRSLESIHDGLSPRIPLVTENLDTADGRRVVLGHVSREEVRTDEENKAADKAKADKEKQDASSNN